MKRRCRSDKTRQAVHVGPVRGFGVVLCLMAESDEEIRVRTVRIAFDIILKEGNQFVRHPRQIICQPEMRAGRPVVRVQPQGAVQVFDPRVHVRVRVPALRERPSGVHVAVSLDPGDVRLIFPGEERHFP